MSFFDWFSRAPSAKEGPGVQSGRAVHNGERVAPVMPQRLGPDPTESENARKAKRQARREQMYIAIREAMTRAGVLSASYRFKVLSLDQAGDEFLAMIDLQQVKGDPALGLNSIETLILQTARQRFGITIPGVYWRLEEVDNLVKLEKAEAVAAAPAGAAASPRFEPIRADEVAAFKQALMVASAAMPEVAVAKGQEKRSRLRIGSSKRNDFEDTKVSDYVSSPLLSATQYGELN